jgi:hypothetical protein
MNVTRHASVRAVQRGIEPIVTRCLFDYGEAVHDHNGAVIYHFTKHGWRRLEREWGHEAVRRLLADYRDAYLVVAVDNDTLITLGRRYKRVKH